MRYFIPKQQRLSSLCNNIHQFVIISSSATMAAVNQLLGDIKMPALGYGTWQAKDEELEAALEQALEVGYRHIDTAYLYENERVIGRVINRWISCGKLKREDLFIVSKLPHIGNRPEGVAKYLRRSLENLQVGYLDVYLIHAPYAYKEVGDLLYPFVDGKIQLDTTTDHVAVWREMEKQVEAGLTKFIGLSNFNQRQIQRILDHAKIPPANLQIELHVYLQQNELVEFCKRHNITVSAYAPLGSRGVVKFSEKLGRKVEIPDVLTCSVAQEVAKKHNKTVAQVLLRHIIQKGVAAIPKSSNPKRLRENIEIFDFSLDGDDVKRLDALDRGSEGRIFDMLHAKGVDEHPEYPFK